MSQNQPTQAPANTQHDSVANCENCGVMLHGTYCHQCGQSRHDPTQHLGHAIEEVFESIWHLDGRIFRTLRDLLVPGRVASQYLAGHRARYVAPFRLFVILSLLTFFVVNLTADIDPETAIQFDEKPEIAQAGTVAAVERLRAKTIATLEAERGRTPAASPVAMAAIETRLAATREEADARIVALREAAPGSTKAPAATSPAIDSAATDDKADLADGKDDPIAIAWLPGFANAWLNAGMTRARRNADRIGDDPERFVHALIGAIPTALFLLVPVFALMLKLGYLFKRRPYLEHLVVALYSHAWLLLSLLVIFLSMALRGALPASAGGFAVALGFLEGALWLWMPLYLLLMQRRVYAQGWPMTILKYAVLGTSYFVLLGFGAAFLFTYVLVKM